MKSSNKNILIIAAHPDDEILGCGGVIQKHKAKKENVFVCIVTDGSSSQYPGDKKIANEKRKECLDANNFLGVSEVFFLDMPDMRLDGVNHIEINKKIEDVINKTTPKIIYTHSLSDLNSDHVEVAKSTLVACRKRKEFLRDVISYESLSSSEFPGKKPFRPNFFVDVEDFLEKKIEAFLIYKTERRLYPHSRSPEGIRILAQYRGLQSNMRAAESFKIILKYER